MAIQMPLIKQHVLSSKFKYTTIKYCISTHGCLSLQC